MIKNIKFFVNDNIETLKKAKLLKDKMEGTGFSSVNKKYELALSLGDYNLFDEVLKLHNYDENMKYCFININSLDEKIINKLIHEIKFEEYSIERLKLMKLKINMEKYILTYLSVDKIVLENCSKPEIYVDGKYIEQEDNLGVLYLLSNHKQNKTNIIYPGPAIVQIVPLEHRNMMNNTVVVPMGKEIVTKFKSRNITLNIDNEMRKFNNISELEIESEVREIKCIKL